MTPYEAMFATKPRIGLENACSSKVTQTIFKENNIETKEELPKVLYPHDSQEESSQNSDIDNTVTSQASDPDLSLQPESEQKEAVKLLVKSPAQVKCAVFCRNECSGAHTCSKCGRICHVICGTHDENHEGYGAEVICNNCTQRSQIDVSLV